jgi:dTDP-4-amino-4,6-dideoxygalactose transaminase
MSQVSTPTKRHVPLLDLSRDHAPLREEILSALARVVDSGRFLFGPEVGQLEQQLAALCGVRHGISCASGSDALLLALMALGIGRGDEVIVPSFTFFATASAVWRLGAKIVFVDIEPSTFNIDTHALALAITSRTRAVIPVHLYGQCARLDEIKRIADRHDVRVIEDAAQAIGAQFKNRPACSWGDVGCLSFYPTKNLGGCGDGGMLVTDNAKLADKLRLLAAHGMSPRYYHHVVGINSRLDTLQAATLLVKLRHLQEWNQLRVRNAQRYLELFRCSRAAAEVTLPHTADECGHVWNQFTIRVPHNHRDRLRQFLSERGVGTEIYYPLPLHRQECFRELVYAEGSLPETERAAAEVLSLPIFPGLQLDEQEWVVNCVADFFVSAHAKSKSLRTQAA